MLEVGMKFPSFSLQDQSGTVRILEEFSGNPLVIYFYPKDDTSGCTVEACEFRDSMPSFENSAVIGVSPDSPKSHEKFVNKFNLNFTLISDQDKTLCQDAGVWVEKSMYGKKYMGVERTTFLLDGTGTITQIWRKVKPSGHSNEVLLALQG